MLRGIAYAQLIGVTSAPPPDCVIIAPASRPFQKLARPGRPDRYSATQRVSKMRPDSNTTLLAAHSRERLGELRDIAFTFA